MVTDLHAAAPVLGAGDPSAVLSQRDVRRIVREHADTLAVDGGRVLVLVPDGTRSAPMPLLFDALRSAFGERVAALDLLVALGTHPPMTSSAVNAMLGCRAEQRAGTQVFNHRWDSDRDLVTLGTVEPEEMAALSGGRLSERLPVRVNRLVTEYDHVLVCGPVFPHEVVGFSGGNKYFFPGVSAPEVIDASHWLGALITSYDIIGTLGTTPVRALIDRATAMVPTPRSALSFVVSPTSTDLHGLYAGTVEGSWAAAAELSSRVHVHYVDRPVRTVLSVVPPMYDELWVAAKGMYKVEPVVADGGEVILYAPHLTEVSVAHAAALRQVGYHSRDWFLSRWEDVREIPRAVLAHATHLAGAGSVDPATGEERRRIRVTLATGIPEEECRALGLDYRDPATVDPADFAGREDDGVLLVPKAGEQLYRLRPPPPSPA